ncbi:hypothetical protein [Stratiformator vulcanicus]|nr:hypothetical protein [Stratiformator vulcanicus]
MTDCRRNSGRAVIGACLTLSFAAAAIGAESDTVLSQRASEISLFGEALIMPVPAWIGGRRAVLPTPEGVSTRAMEQVATAKKADFSPDSKDDRWYSFNGSTTSSHGVVIQQVQAELPAPTPGEAADEALPTPRSGDEPLTPSRPNLDGDDLDMRPDIADAIYARRCEFGEAELATLLKPTTQLTATLGTTDMAVPCDPAADLFDQWGDRYVIAQPWANVTPEPMEFCFHHQPLWFEDANLERCGRTIGCLQPALSGAYFFANTTTIPYRFAAECPKDLVCAKQFCGPCQKYSIADNYLPPPSVKGAVAQALAVTGLFFVIP